MRSLPARAWLMSEIDRKSVLASIRRAGGALCDRGRVKISKRGEESLPIGATSGGRRIKYLPEALASSGVL